MADHRADEVLGFWFGEGAERGKAHKRWFEKNSAFDAEVRARFLPLYEELAAGADWLAQPGDCLARIVVLDQFPRNMFRGSARAFAADPLALAAAKHAVASGFDRDMQTVEKQFVYLPFEHSELLADQERACDLMQPLSDDLYDWALRHKRIIERFGRFPHRNEILGRASTPEEVEFLKQPGSGF
ncbi:MAG: hypothetical protein QOD26_4115 [Betaproteobacteria bacterium]|jgi:uncharacterized protein (DUF924 family)|nr:hypothetical protein [Betaproteobacteria bacterium]